ncbi:NACHT domain-containing NTPase [Amycolatopsis sp. DSM 110486]|uniref:NACHT domain-containing protein n=1 Tax=Amycolatopsis sp. DSM 110486 TaxID=2865832 RepID=UPI001C69C2BA|nr:NACHT domain-containing protein [Amycolatopsis sp. DSM 110486]QYN19372.1 NACHT domain-containing protein [Amycolatopsis sp. DSM 110486]
MASLGATFSALYQWAVERGADKLTAQRRARALGDPHRQLVAAEEDLAELRRVEFPAVSDGDSQAALDAAAVALDAADVGGLVRTNPAVLVDEDRLRARVRTAGGQALDAAALGADATAAFHRLLDECCRRVARRARAVDEVMRAVQAGMAGDVLKIRRAVADLQSQEDRRTRDRAEAFEQHYLSYLATDYATFELFQVGHGRAPVRHSFSQYYAAPSVTRQGGTAAGSALTGAGTNTAHALAAERRVLLVGGAGAGKTTLLQWLAYTAATAEFTGDGESEDPWRGVVPFFVPLREFADRGLPQPEDLVRVTAPALAGEKPARWVSELLRSGRAMVLVDGVDEVLQPRREEVRRWLEGLLRGYPGARYVVSTRPAVVDPEWPIAGEPFPAYELLPLSGRGMRELIGNWFSAARAMETDELQRSWLADCEQRLGDSLATRPDVRGLVSSPLLCSLLCALYRRENMYLPQSRKDLLDKALKLLLGEWDTRRGVQVEDELKMSDKEKIILLERFAAPMVRNAELLVHPEDARKRFGRAMSGLRSQGIEPDLVLRHLLERSGVLRQNAVDGRIAFVHRTFRDFLAAGEFVKSGELGYLVEHAHDDALNEVVFMVAAQARAREAGDLLARLLERARKRGNREVADRLSLLAAAEMSYVDVIEPEQVRTDVLAAVRRLIPPAGFDQAELLAKAGAFVIDLLPGPAEIARHASADADLVAARVIRTLALIGGEESWEKIQAFSRTHRGSVIDELLRAWRHNEYSEEYAATLLSTVDFGDFVLEVHRWDVLRRLRHLRTLTAIQLVGDMTLDDPALGLHPLTRLPALRHLEIKSNDVVHDLEGLVACRALRSLWITGFGSALTDLSALSRMHLTDLRLHAGTLDAIQALASVEGTYLPRLSVRHRKLVDGLDVLPEGLRVGELVVDMGADQRDLRGITRLADVHTVAAAGIPSVAEVDELAALPSLRALVLTAATPARDLVRLRRLGALRIELSGLTPADERAAREALPEADLVLHLDQAASITER